MRFVWTGFMGFTNLQTKFMGNYNLENFNGLKWDAINTNLYKKYNIPSFLNYIFPRKHPHSLLVYTSSCLPNYPKMSAKQAKTASLHGADGSRTNPVSWTCLKIFAWKLNFKITGTVYSASPPASEKLHW